MNKWVDYVICSVQHSSGQTSSQIQGWNALTPASEAIPYLQANDFIRNKLLETPKLPADRMVRRLNVFRFPYYRIWGHRQSLKQHLSAATPTQPQDGCSIPLPFCHLLPPQALFSHAVFRGRGLHCSGSSLGKGLHLSSLWGFLGESYRPGNSPFEFRPRSKKARLTVQLTRNTS